MLTTDNRSRLAGLPDGLQMGGPGNGPTGNGYKTILPPPSLLSKREAYRQIVACLAACEALLDQIAGGEL